MIGSTDRAGLESCYRRRIKWPIARGVGEAQTPVAELLAQDAVRLLETLDDLELAAVRPAREHAQQESGPARPTSSANLPRGDRVRSDPRGATSGRAQCCRVASTPILCWWSSSSAKGPDGSI